MLDPEAVCNKLTRPFEYPAIFVSLEGQRTGRGEEALSVPFARPELGSHIRILGLSRYASQPGQSMLPMALVPR